jgi:hypothetical protein
MHLKSVVKYLITISISGAAKRGQVAHTRVYPKVSGLSHNKIYTYFSITRREATQRVMAAKLTRLTHKIAIQMHVVAESCAICSSRSRRPVRKLLVTHPRIEAKKFTNFTMLPQLLFSVIRRIFHSSSGSTSR